MFKNNLFAFLTIFKRPDDSLKLRRHGKVKEKVRKIYKIKNLLYQLNHAKDGIKAKSPLHFHDQILIFQKMNTMAIFLPLSAKILRAVTTVSTNSTLNSQCC